MAFFGADLGIDLGTCNTRVYVKGAGIVYQEPSVIALAARTLETLDVGQAAQAMAEQESGDVLIVHPLSCGVIADWESAEKLLKNLMQRVLGKFLFGPNVVATVMSGATLAESFMLRQVLHNAGARRVQLVDAALADALGAGLGLHRSGARLIIDAGGGCTDLGVTVNGAVVMSRSIRFGGLDLDESLRRYVRHKYGMTITPGSAESLKLRVGSVSPELQKEQVQLDGVKVYGELFRSISVPLDGVPQLLAASMRNICNEVRWMMDELNPEHRMRVTDGGAVLTGGLSGLRGVEPLVTDLLKLPVTTVPAPLECAASGLGVIQQNPQRLRVDGRHYATR